MASSASQSAFQFESIFGVRPREAAIGVEVADEGTHVNHSRNRQRGECKIATQPEKGTVPMAP